MTTKIHTTIKNKKLVAKKREKIVLTALDLFCRQGFHKTSLREISEAAGISQGSIYDYIRTKEDIFHLIYDYLATSMEADFGQSVQDHGDPLEKLKEMIRIEFNLIQKMSDAFLLMYQETHTLSKPLIKSLLEREKRRVVVFERAIDECIEKGIFRDFNSLIAANLLMCLIHAYVLRRWDLTRHVAIKEMERSVIELFCEGLIKQHDSGTGKIQDQMPLKGKTVLIVDSVICKPLSAFLISKGARLAVHTDNVVTEKELLESFAGNAGDITFYPIKDYGQLTPHLFDKINSDLGPINVFIQVLSFHETNPSLAMEEASSVGQRLEYDFKCAENFPALLEKSMNKLGSGRVILIAPWAWDSYTSPLNYEMLKTGTVTLTKAMSKRLAPSRINVNCIVPGFISGIKKPDREREKMQQLMELIPLKTLGELQDIYEAICYFASDASKYVTGQCLEIAGGTILDERSAV